MLNEYSFSSNISNSAVVTDYGNYKQNKKDWLGGNWKCNSFYKT